MILYCLIRFTVNSVPSALFIWYAPSPVPSGAAIISTDVPRLSDKVLTSSLSDGNFTLEHPVN